jgi:hypothetical protein
MHIWILQKRESGTTFRRFFSGRGEELWKEFRLNCPGICDKLTI